MRNARRWLPVFAVALMACGNEGQAEPEQPTVDGALVGTWVGPIEVGPAGNIVLSGTITMILNADGSMSASSANPRFSPINDGRWGVAAGEFSASGVDTQGTTVLFVAPRSATRLDGTVRTAGVSGTFDITKQ